MLAATLNRLIDDKLTTPKELAQVAGVALSTVYRWLDRSGEPDFSQLIALMSKMSNLQAREGVLLALVADSDFHVMPRSGILDVNGDGVIDQHDALEAVCLAIGHTTNSLQAINQATHDRSLSNEELSQVQALLQEAMHQCATTQAVLVHMNTGRKPARPLSTPH